MKRSPQGKLSKSAAAAMWFINQKKLGAQILHLINLGSIASRLLRISRLYRLWGREKLAAKEH